MLLRPILQGYEDQQVASIERQLQLTAQKNFMGVGKLYPSSRQLESSAKMFSVLINQTQQ